MKRSDIPNFITFVRILLVAPILVLMVKQSFGWALVLFAIAGVSDAVDGFLAKHYGWTSRLGSVIDPLADKLLLVSSYLVLTWLALIPVWVLLFVLVRDVVILVGAIGYHFRFGHYDMEPSLVSKVNTLMQIILVCSVMLSQAALPFEPILLLGLNCLVAITSLASGVHYVWVWGGRAWHASRGRSSS